MANCPLCGGTYPQGAGKIINPDYKDIRVCSKCYLKKGQYNSLILQNKQDEVNKLYDAWAQNLEKHCFEEITRDTIIKWLDAPELYEKLNSRKLEQAEKEEYRKKIEKFMMTSGYNFEGYKVVKYHRLISASTVMGTGMISETSAAWADILGLRSNAFELKMDKAKEISHQKLAIAADKIGANAILGVDFDYLTLGNNMIAVSANGTAVTIEPL